MASIYKLGKKWRAQVARNGVRISEMFATKAEATSWAAVKEAELLRQKRGEAPSKTFQDALDRYAEEVSPTKRGMRSERLRLYALSREFPQLVNKQLADIGTPDIAAWRDARLKVVSKGSVQRDINLLRNVFSIARDEWKWISESPFKGMKTPGNNPPRTRLPKWQEVKAICRWLGYITNSIPHSKQAETAYAFLVSLRTGMRAGEILSLSTKNVSLDRRVASVSHKTEHITGRPRDIPLSKHATRLLSVLTSFPLGEEAPAGGRKLFSVSSASLDALFRKATTNLQIDNLHFHDARADALTRFAKKVDVLRLARISGHKDIKTLMEHYYRESASDVARQLDL
jgi:integrase